MKMETRKYRKKIKIRLLDTNDPDSYICELFDSSTENEDLSAFGENFSSSESFKSTNDCNWKNYFEILMSNQCRKNIQNGSAKENEIVKVSNGMKDNGGRSKTVKKKFNKAKSKRMQLMKEKRFSMSSSDHESHSSDEKLANQIDGKGKSKNNFVNGSHSELSNKVKKSKLEVVHKSNVTMSTESICQKKNLNILNYFFKTETEVKDEMKGNCGIVILENNSKYSHMENDRNTITESTLNESSKIDQEKYNRILKKENVKLAPLFIKKEKKAVDVDLTKSHYDFLHKEPMLSKASKNKNVEVVSDYIPTCHIQQRDDSVYWSLREISWPLSNPPMKEFKSTKKFTTNILKSQLLKNNRGIEKTIKDNSVEANHKAIKQIKSKYSKLNFDSLIDGLKYKKDKFVNLTSFEISKSFDKKNDNSGNDLINSLWTEKYKPSSSEMLGNENVVKQLKNWLQSWKAFDKEQKNLMEASDNFKRMESDDSDDEDDYFLDPNKKNLKLKAPKNVCLLSGPTGSGKTALVSSLAEELDFNVIEVNSSTKRTGKKVLTDFQEATRSHKVQHVSLPQSKIIPKQFKRNKNKKTNVKNSYENSIVDKENYRKITLLLIEDADVVFEEHDEGFYSAINSLVQCSKRPFVFITNGTNCEQFDTFKPEECLVLEMDRSPFNKSCALLDVVSLLEGFRLEKETAEFILRRNRFDLRKSLLDLEFWKSPAEKIMTEVQEFDLGRLWWGLSKFLYSSDAEKFVGSIRCKRKREMFVGGEDDDDEEESVAKKKVKTNSKIRGREKSFESVTGRGSNQVKSNKMANLDSYSNILDVASILDLIGFSRTEEPIPGIDYKAKTGSSLEENTESVFFADNKLREEICNDLVALSAQVFSASRKEREKMEEEKKINFSFPSWEEVRWRNFQEETEKNLSALIPLVNGRNKRSVHLDYLPIIRNICRMEKNRSMAKSKRKNRFFHYFNNAGIRICEKSLEMSCKVFAGG